MVSGSAALPLISAGVAPANPSGTPVSTAKVDCVVFDTASNTCTVVGVVYALTQVGGTTYA